MFVCTIVTCIIPLDISSFQIYHPNLISIKDDPISHDVS